MVSWIHTWRIFISSDCKTDKQKRILSSQGYSSSSWCKYDWLHWWDIFTYSLYHDRWICSSEIWMIWEFRYTTRLLRVYPKESYLVQYTRLREKRVHYGRSQAPQTKHGIYRDYKLYIWWLSPNSFCTQRSLSRSHSPKMSGAYTTTSEELYFK